VLQQLKVWREHLVDLTARNPLLGINRSRTSKLFIERPSADSLFSALVAEGRQLTLPHVRPSRVPAGPSGADPVTEVDQPWDVLPGDISFEASPNDLKRRLRRIKDNARTTLEERG
jgi:hypothetical protein